MGAENMEHCESKFTTSERRILIAYFLEKAINFVINYNYYDMCVGCFECTLCQITMLPSDKYDAKIRPQGIPHGKFSIPKEHQNDTDDDDNVVNENIKPQGEGEEYLVRD